MRRAAQGSGARFPRAASLIVVLYPYTLPALGLVGRLDRRARETILGWLVPAGLLAASAAIRREAELVPLVVLLAPLAELVGRRVTDDATRRGVALGLSAGIVTLAAVALVQGTAIGGDRASGPYWMGHPNLFAHYLLIAAVTAAVLSPGRSVTLLLLATLAAIAVTGSRSGVVGAGVALIGSAFTFRELRRPVATAAGLSAAALVALALAAPAPWATRLGPALLAELVGWVPKNLLVSTEALTDAKRWNPLGVDVTREPGSGDAVWRLVRRARGTWPRPQQTVGLQEGQTYTLTGEFRAEAGRSPGFLVWRGTTGSRLELAAGLTPAGEAFVTAGAGVAAAEAVATDLGGGWRRLTVSFVPASAGPVALGPVPDLATDEVGAIVRVRRLQLGEGAEASAYSPTTSVSTGAGEAMVRLPAWRVAWQGFLGSPLVGQGSRAFSSSYSAHYPDAESPPAHAHDVFLDVAFSYGALGLVAIVAVLGRLFQVAGPAMRWALAGLLAANLVDSTFLTMTVLWPLAAGVALARRER